MAGKEHKPIPKYLTQNIITVKKSRNVVGNHSYIIIMSIWFRCTGCHKKVQLANHFWI